MTGLTTRQKALKLKEELLCQAYNVACDCDTTYEVAAGRSAPEMLQLRGTWSSVSAVIAGHTRRRSA